jgi:predicted Zn finger-like uncharacterized protein
MKAILYPSKWVWECPECENWNETTEGDEPDNDKKVYCEHCEKTFEHQKKPY